MKNVKNLFGMAVMATALVGCSSNDNLNPNANEGADKAGTAYAKFTIQLPTVSGTRAPGDSDGTPEFNGGKASEYAVDNATVLVFKKATTEDDYTFVTSAPIGNMAPWNKDNDDQNGVTTEARVTAELKGLSQEDINAKNYYALILLNNDIDATAKKVKMPTEGETYKKWNIDDFASNVNAEQYVSTTKGIFMANAPEYKVSGEPTTLVPITGIYNTKEAANSHEGTTVHVERGLSKVTVEAGTKSITDGVYNGASVDINDWTLDVLNKKTYAVHVTTGLNSATNFAKIWETKRFYDAYDATTTPARFQRVYWGMDPNYSDLTGKTELSDYASDFSIMDGAAKFTAAPFVSPVNGVDAKFVNSGKSMYCLENTFDINNMTQGQTTRVVFKAKYTPKDYETETIGTGTSLKKNNDLLNSEKAGTFFMLGKNPQTWTPIALTKQITTYTVEAYNAANPTATIDASKVSVDLTGITIDNTGKVNFSSIGIKVNSAALDTPVSGTVSAKLGEIIAYTCGTSYYIARIKHFNALTPWVAGEPTYTATSLTAEQSNTKYLGRYGVLRNNWYCLTVDKVSNPGSPTVPTITPNNPDDENKYYISVSVKILDWAKRSQTVDL